MDWMNGWDGWMDGMDGWNGWMDGMDEWMDEWMDSKNNNNKIQIGKGNQRKRSKRKRKKYGLDRLDGWMGLDESFFKIIVPRLHVPAGAFFMRKSTFPEKMICLENR